MKVGDLVKDNHPNRGMGSERIGVIIGQMPPGHYRRAIASNNKLSKVLWRDGTTGNNVWDYDLKIVKSP